MDEAEPVITVGRARPDYPYLFHRWRSGRLTFRQLAALPEAAGVSRQAIQKEFARPTWRAQLEALEQAHTANPLPPSAAGAELPPVAREPQFVAPTNPGLLASPDNHEDEAKRILQAQRAEILVERESIARDTELLRKIESGRATEEEKERMLGINRDTIMDAKRKLLDRTHKVQEMERKCWPIDSQMEEVRQFLPIVDRRGVPTMA